jgi:ABC-2 type transport system ATP-binding protein
MASVEAGSALELQELRKSFGAVHAVRDLSLSIRTGEVFGLLGPNGAGKTTAIRMICGLLKPDGGRVLIHGTALSEAPRKARRSIGLCPQELVIWGTLTCLEQLTFLGTQYGQTRVEARNQGRELLRSLGLEEKERSLAKTLSGGMKRRLNLALALVHDPDILILDEPQAGLDPQSRVLVREYIQALSHDKTVVLTTHEMDEADRLAQRIGIIDGGELLVLDDPASLKQAHAGGEVLELTLPTSKEDFDTLISALPPGVVVLESLPGTIRLSGRRLQDALPLLFATLAKEGLDPEDITLRKPTLEDVFISLTGRRLRE